ncbi:MAG: biopolymer transporter ExbD [Planctomycetaceae bacterium]|nr:biopolymer transporter ExbD [Planctomycetaceae bacterium]
MKALQEEDNFDIPMTSLIDIVFLLLIFFLVATNFNRRETDHSVVLPQSESGVKAENVPSRLVINIRHEGTLVVNGSVLSQAELRALAGEFVAAHPGRPAVIRADAQVPYRAVMQVFGICRGAGVVNVDLPVLEPGEQ